MRRNRQIHHRPLRPSSQKSININGRQDLFRKELSDRLSVSTVHAIVAGNLAFQALPLPPRAAVVPHPKNKINLPEELLAIRKPFNERQNLINDNLIFPEDSFDGVVEKNIIDNIYSDDLEEKLSPQFSHSEVNRLFLGICEASQYAQLTPQSKIKTMVNRILELEAENRYLSERAMIANQFVPELSPLEREVADLVAGKTKPAEYYSTRSDRKTNAIEFLRRHYGRYLEKGDEALFQVDLVKIDPSLRRALFSYCTFHGGAVSDYIPARTERTKRTLASISAESVKVASRIHNLYYAASR